MFQAVIAVRDQCRNSFSALPSVLLSSSKYLLNTWNFSSIENRWEFGSVVRFSGAPGKYAVDGELDQDPM